MEPNGLGRDLYIACSRGDAALARGLLRSGASPRWTDPATGRAALHAAAICQDPGVAELLLSHDSSKIEHNAKDSTGCTAFLLACREGKPATIAHLARNPTIDLTARDVHGTTGLIHLCYRGLLDEANLVLALGRGAEMDARDANGLSAWDYCTHGTKMALRNCLGMSAGLVVGNGGVGVPPVPPNGMKRLLDKLSFHKKPDAEGSVVAQSDEARAAIERERIERGMAAKQLAEMEYRRAQQEEFARRRAEAEAKEAQERRRIEDLARANYLNCQEAERARLVREQNQNRNLHPRLSQSQYPTTPNSSTDSFYARAPSDDIYNTLERERKAEEARKEAERKWMEAECRRLELEIAKKENAERERERKARERERERQREREVIQAEMDRRMAEIREREIGELELQRERERDQIREEMALLETLLEQAKLEEKRVDPRRSEAAISEPWRPPESRGSTAAISEPWLPSREVRNSVSIPVSSGIVSVADPRTSGKGDRSLASIPISGAALSAPAPRTSERRWSETNLSDSPTIGGNSTTHSSRSSASTARHSTASSIAVSVEQPRSLRKSSTDPEPKPPKTENRPYKLFWIEETDVLIDRSRSLGRGGFAEVFAGKYQVFNDVAVKVLHVSGRVSDEAFNAELRIWAELPAHDHIAPLLGYRTNPTYLVTKLYAGRSMKAYLTEKKWDLNLTLRLLHEVAVGMTFLHSKNIIHSDLKAENVLIDVIGGHGIARIADFGLAKIKTRVNGQSEYDGLEGATIRYAPPEYFNVKPLRKPSDVWTFAMMAYNVLNKGREPYADRMTQPAISRAVREGILPEKFGGLPEGLWELLEECWKDPQERPTFAAIAGRLHSFVVA